MKLVFQSFVSQVMYNPEGENIFTPPTTYIPSLFTAEIPTSSFPQQQISTVYKRWPIGMVLSILYTTANRS